ncbi:MAG: aspartyl/glutamyl-tRNA amidotransferase subunit C, partial [Oscillospiraceae bacterium]|nr:aspartyl/glutamyl-tRNA amidotransferase subunit C [Oscillospiraceae bacterium]
MFNIKAYENMSMLDLPADQREQLNACAETLISGFATLETIDADNVEPLVTVLDLHNILREDTAAKLFTREEILSNAP